MPLPSMICNGKRILLKLNKVEERVPKGHIAVYVGDDKKTRYIVPLSYLTHPSLQSLPDRAEEEFSFTHPMGGLTIACREEEFIDLTFRF
ncbi:hypothetical protein Ancab_016966 [Ancistrocladus abbreviatus]